jgi:sugar lactone lactonase YvrE
LTSRAKIGVTIVPLLLLSMLLPTPHVAGFSNSQLPAIRIGEQKSPSYGILTPWGGLTFDPSGNLWVADSENNLVLEFAPPFSGNMSASFVIGQPNFQGTTAGASAGGLKFPMNVVFDHAGNLWVSDTDNSRVLEFEPPFRNGMNASVVIGQSNFLTAFFNTTRNALSGPEQDVFDSSGNLWVADGGNARILEFQPPFSTGMNASLVIGEPDFTHRYCQPSTLGYETTCSNHSLLTYPSGIAFDLQGDLWITDSYAVNGRLLEFTPPFKNGMQASLVMQPVFSSAIKFDSAGNLWLACQFCYGGGGGSVVEYRPPFSEHSIVWENGYALNASVRLGGYGENPPLSSVLVLPVGLTFDSAGNLWVVDARSSWLIGLNGRVVGYDAQVHPLDTLEGRVYFENDLGLLAPLSWIPTTRVVVMSYPEGVFNFTIQGLRPGGSVNITITFPDPFPSGIGWWNISRGNPMSSGEFDLRQFPQSQVEVDGNRMTLMLTNASEAGVISVLGGPAVPPITSISATSANSTTQTQTPVGLPASLIAVPLAIAIVGIAFVIRRKRRVARA